VPSINFHKLQSNTIDISSLDSVRDSVIGVMRSDNSYEFLVSKGFKEGVNLDIVADEDINIRKLVNGNVDLIVQSKESLKYRMKLLGFENIETVSGYSLHMNDEEKHCMGLSKNSDLEIIDKLNLGFKQWVKLQ
jgi:polar amino acid transport system substrate-binding protein